MFATCHERSVQKNKQHAIRTARLNCKAVKEVVEFNQARNINILSLPVSLLPWGAEPSYAYRLGDVPEGTSMLEEAGGLLKLHGHRVLVFNTSLLGL